MSSNSTLKNKIADAAKSEAKKPKVAVVAEIVRSEGAITVPPNMSLADAARLLVQKAEEEEQEVNFQRSFEKTLPPDGAWGLKAVLDEVFAGMASTQAQNGWFGKELPKTIQEKSGPNGQITEIPWGTYELPNGIIMKTAANLNKQKGLFYFIAHGTCQRRYLTLVNTILDKLTVHLKENSLYRGKALSVEFTNEDGERHERAEIDFMDLSKFVDTGAIFSREITEEIRAFIYNPLASLRPRKIGVLLSGIPGVGKTLVMSIAAHLAQKAGRTVIYCHSRDFTTALRFAMNYEGENGAVVVCEDIDRILSGARNATIDGIYNALDGPDTKHANVSVLLTTNDLSVIPDPMLRPGRVRHTLELTPPDAAAVLKLLVHYSGNKLDASVNPDDLRSVADRLAGRIPAVIADVVARALDSAEYNGRDTITLHDFTVAERSMSKQLHLLEERNRHEETPSFIEKAATILAKSITATHAPVAAASQTLLDGLAHVHTADGGICQGSDIESAPSGADYTGSSLTNAD